MAPNADLRPFQMAALCSGLWLMRTALGLKRLAMSVTAASRSAISSLEPSTSTISSASTSVG